MFKVLNSNIKIITLFSLLFCLFAFFGFSEIKIPKSNAQSSNQKLYGYAWSENIGWISFASTTNGNNFVEIDSNGFLNGYAWSENIGWIKFGGLTDFPIGSGTLQENAKFNFNNNKIQGWARACSGTINGNCSSMQSRTDGWDGWISMSGISPDYSVKINNSNSNDPSYAWGSDVVGWIDFKNVILSETNTLNCAYNNQFMQALPSQGFLCTNGSGASTVPDNLQINETQIEDLTPNGTDIYDYQYSWTCGGNSCSVTTELKNSNNSTYDLDARLVPSIVENPTDMCTVLWNTPENYSCIIRKSNSEEHQDASVNQGHQVEVGSGYYVHCTEIVSTTGVIYNSQPMTCLLNPKIKEI